MKSLKRVNSTPWCVRTNSMRKRPPFTHEQNLDMEEAFELNKFAVKQNLDFMRHYISCEYYFLSDYYTE